MSVPTKFRQLKIKDKDRWSLFGCDQPRNGCIQLGNGGEFVNYQEDFPMPDWLIRFLAAHYDEHENMNGAGI